METDLTCIHMDSRLCEACQRDFAEDPMAWIEFGAHPAGQHRWELLRQEMDAEAAAERSRQDKEPAPGPFSEDEIPY